MRGLIVFLLAAGGCEHAAAPLYTTRPIAVVVAPHFLVARDLDGSVAAGPHYFRLDASSAKDTLLSLQLRRVD